MSQASFCRGCGKPLTDQEKAIAGNVFCSVCAPAQATGQGVPPGNSAGDTPGTQSSYTPPPGYTPPPPGYVPPGYGAQPGRPVPGLAFALGLIPGVGAIYNAQYVKGLVHAVVFGLLAAGSDSGDDSIFGFVLAAFIFYMAFEAYHTAQRRLAGMPVDEFSSILPRHAGGGFPVVPVLLIVLGVIFLATNLGLLRFDWLVRFWPVGLIALGVYLLYERMKQPVPFGPERQIEGVSDEPNRAA